MSLRLAFNAYLENVQDSNKLRKLLESVKQKCVNDRELDPIVPRAYYWNRQKRKTSGDCNGELQRKSTEAENLRKELMTQKTNLNDLQNQLKELETAFESMNNMAVPKPVVTVCPPVVNVIRDDQPYHECKVKVNQLKEIIKGHLSEVFDNIGRLGEFG